MFHTICGAAALAVAVAVASPVLAQTADKKAPEPKANAVSMETAMASVNGQVISMGDMMAARSALPAPYNQASMQELYEPLLREMIERRLIAAAAEKSKLFEDPAVARRLKENRARILQEEFLRRRIEPALSEEKLRARYQTMAQGSGEEEVHARHILVASKNDADAVVAELEKGAKFEDLAKTRSTGPSGSKGGDLGFFKKSAMVPEFADVAFSLQAGEVSEPVKTQFGWHIIKLEARRKSPPPPFESKVKELRQATVSEEVRKIVSDLSKDADIKTFNLDGSPRKTGDTGQ
jgi:peptidyl-prolyl cis-trans isomerase C